MTVHLAQGNSSDQLDQVSGFQCDSRVKERRKVCKELLGEFQESVLAAMTAEPPSLPLHPSQIVRFPMPLLWQNEDVEALASLGSNLEGIPGCKRLKLLPENQFCFDLCYWCSKRKAKKCKILTGSWNHSHSCSIFLKTCIFPLRFNEVIASLPIEFYCHKISDSSYINTSALHQW